MSHRKRYKNASEYGHYVTVTPYRLCQCVCEVSIAVRMWTCTSSPTSRTYDVCVSKCVCGVCVGMCVSSRTSRCMSALTCALANKLCEVSVSLCASVRVQQVAGEHVGADVRAARRDGAARQLGGRRRRAARGRAAADGVHRVAGQDLPRHAHQADRQRECTHLYLSCYIIK